LWFASERGTPFTPDAINRLVKRLGDGDKLLGFPIHFHMLRHSCGYALANAGHETRAIQDYLGHKAIQHTVRYTELAHRATQAAWPPSEARFDRKNDMSFLNGGIVFCRPRRTAG
jgi:type 1 fimbriae regulatory protein FimB/type 1 fimbriae regulatory protein FimE